MPELQAKVHNKGETGQMHLLREDVQNTGSHNSKSQRPRDSENPLLQGGHEVKHMPRSKLKRTLEIALAIPAWILVIMLLPTLCIIGKVVNRMEDQLMRRGAAE